MLEPGYKLASEEHGPNELVRFAGLAEEHGFAFALISDHFHPWTDRQGQSPFVWSVIGAIAHSTRRLELGTAVTCPTMRVHPAIVAQAAATAARKAGGGRKPRYGELTVCWGKDEAKARQTARERWPTAAMESSLSWELPLPAHFEAVAELVTEDEVGKYVVCGPDPKRHLEAIQKYADAGYDHVCVHQVGPDQAGFMEFYAAEIFPRLRSHRRKAA